MTGFSEDTYWGLDLAENQTIGRYNIAEKVGSFDDRFDISVDGTSIGTIKNDNPILEYGNYAYTVTHDALNQKLYLDINVSDNAGTDFGILYYDNDGEFHHTSLLRGVSLNSTDYKNLIVRNGGVLSDSELTSGLLTVKSGASIENLRLTNGKLTFDYDGTDNTNITGTSLCGDFSVRDGVLTNMAFLEDAIIRNSSLNGLNNGTVTVHGGNVTGDITGKVYLRSNAQGMDINSVNSEINIERATIKDSTINGGKLQLLDGSNAENITVDGGTLSIWGDQSVIGNITISKDARLELLGNVSLSEDIYVAGSLYTNSYSFHWHEPDQSYWQSIGRSGSLDGNGHTVNFDISTLSAFSDVTLVEYFNQFINTQVVFALSNNQEVGSYSIGKHVDKFGQINTVGIWDEDTNTWDYQGSTYGDLDGIIELRDENGFLLANCTVNGDTEYFGRYNYTVRTDSDGNMFLDIGWNTREGRTYAADGFDNNTRAKAAVLLANGTKLTIDSASDADWFKLTLEEAGRASSYFGIDFKQWAGDLDLYLYDGSGNLIDYAKSVTDNERISLRGLAKGDYYVKVEGYEGNLGEYTLNYSLPEKQALTDEYEKGNSPLFNTYLGGIARSVTVSGAIQRADDVDYYSFALARKGTSADSVTLTFDTEYGDLDLYLYDVNGIFQLGKSVSTTSGTETISLKGLSRGVYIVKVVSKDGLTVADYDLTIDIHSTDVNPDKYENNNTLRKAKNLYTLNGNDSLAGLSIHDESDIDYYKFAIKEKGSADDWIAIDYKASLGDLDLEILDADGNVVAWSRTAENTDTASLKGLETGDYYIRVTGYDGAANNYTLSWNVTNSSMIASDPYEGNEPIAIREDQTITGLSIAKVRKEDETRADVFRISLEHNAWKRTKIILSDYRADWDDGMAYVLKDADGNVLQEGTGAEISLAGLRAGDYYLTVDTPNEGEYTTYSLTAQGMPDSDAEVSNTWTLFIYLAGDNNLEGAYLTELLYMQRAILPEDVDAYVLMDRSEGYSTAQRDWTDTRVGKIRHSEGGAVAVEWMYFDGEDTSTYMNTSNLELKQEWDTGDVATLEAFLDWGMKTAPAEHYALIMKDHGTSLGYNSSDVKSGSIMSITDIAGLLADPKYNRLEVAAFDQCLMGSDVVVTTMEGTVDYVVASEAVGYTPNQLMMYKVLFNSLETDMTAQELAKKMVKACNCSGRLDLTLASFNTAGSTLSEALNAFGGAMSGFTRNDWVAVCKSFALANNYGDDICAYSDLGFLLNAIKGYATTISSMLLTAAETLYDAVISLVIDAAQITPATYGSGLAVFNPVLSDPLMNFYSYGPGANLDYYGTAIGSDAWGQFLYTAGQLADDMTEYFTDSAANLTFTDFSYYFEDDEMQVVYNLGAFYGDGVEYHGLYMDEKMMFTVTLEQAGIEGDAIRVVADNPDANVTLTLIQQRATLQAVEQSIRRTSTNGTLSLKGVDPVKAGMLSEYIFVITSDQETTFDLYFDADWSSGSDYFDYSRSSNRLGGQGNGSIDKATVLAAGNYGGLVTHAGDADYYQLNTVYTEQLDVVVTGTGLTVCEYAADGTLLQTADEADGKYSLTVGNGNYLYVKGDADLSRNATNAYGLEISDIAHTYLAPEIAEGSMPTLTATPNTTEPAREVVFTAATDEGMETYYTLNLDSWTKFEGTATITQNGFYFFKAVNPETLMESRYVTHEVTCIDREPPVIELTGDTTTPLQQSALTASTEEGLKLYFNTESADFDGEWTEYTGELEVTANATYYFKATDAAGNVGTAQIAFANIDTVAPLIELFGDTTTPLQASTLTASTDAGLKLYYNTESADYAGAWTEYTGEISVNENATYYFKATDAAGNTGTASITFANIDKMAPEAPTASADITDPTNQNVTVTAVFSDDSTLKEYSLDGRTWSAYTQPVVLSDNGTVSFRGTDDAGNVSDITSYEVTNIDKVAPDAPTTSADITAPTNGFVTVTATFSGDSVTMQVSLDGTDWYNYSQPIVMTANGWVYFRGIDAAGNVSEVTGYEVTNIDITAPNAPTALADITAPTNGNVTVTAIFSDDCTLKEYSLDGQTWSAYTQPVVLSDNGTVSFRGTDDAGNVSDITTYEVTNIDKVAPDAPTASADITEPTNGDVTVTAVFSDDSTLKEYSLDGQSWSAYTEPVVFSENGTVSFRGTDEAGNVSEVTTCEVANIDKVAPDAPTALADVTDPTNGDVTVTATFSDDSTLKEYSLDGQSWSAYTEPVVFSENGTVSFRGTDAAGNVSEVTSYEVTNIDKAAPVAVGGLSAQVTKNTIAFSWGGTTDNLSGVAKYEIQVSDTVDFSQLVASQSGAALTSFSANFTVSGTYHYRVRATDAVGNVSEWNSASVEFEFVDSTPPTKPTGLQLAQNGTKVTFSWKASTDADSGVAGYELKLVRNDHTETITQVAGTSVTLDLVESNYSWSVAAKDNFGNVSEAVSGEDFRLLLPVGTPKQINLSQAGVAELGKGTKSDEVFKLAADSAWGTYHVAQWNGGDDAVDLVGFNRFYDAVSGNGGYDAVQLPNGDNGLLYSDLLSPVAAGVDASARFSDIAEIIGNSGKDVIDLTDAAGGYAGEVLLKGGAGDDHLWTGKGDDILVGGAGNDDLRGGAGDDLYLFGENWGRDTILDDGGTLVFDNALKDKLSFSATGDGTRITDGTNAVELTWQISASEVVYADVSELVELRRDTIKGFLA